MYGSEELSDLHCTLNYCQGFARLLNTHGALAKRAAVAGGPGEGAWVRPPASAWLRYPAGLRQSPVGRRGA